MIMSRWNHFFGTLKVEKVYINNYQLDEDVITLISYFIDEKYITKKDYILFWVYAPEEFKDRFNKNESH